MNALVTGGTRGLGLAIAAELMRRAAGGGRVAVTWLHDPRDADAAREVLLPLAADVRVVRGDAADPAHARALVDELVGAWGSLDVVVNNAGVHQLLPIALVEEADWDLVVDSNLKGAYVISRAALRPMIRAKRGVILNIGAFSSERVVDVPAHWAAAKAGLRGLTEALAREVGRYGVRVVLLAPGLLDAGASRLLPRHRLDEYRAQSPAGRLQTVDELARFAAFLVSDDAALITGAKVVVDGGI